MEFTIGLRLLAFAVFMIVLYFVLKYYDIDFLEMVRDFFADIFESFEWNVVGVVLTLLFSAIMWGFLWLTPWWATTDCGTVFCVTGLPAKIIMSVLLPIIGYPLALRALNR